MCHGSGDGRILHSASSYHPGGVNAAYYDGSVRFIQNTINAGDPNTGKIKTSGASDFGVWGALGTINGGEASAL